jgi:hypothetical protein
MYFAHIYILVCTVLLQGDGVSLPATGFEECQQWELVDSFDVRLDLHVSIIPDDPTTTQLKV